MEHLQGSSWEKLEDGNENHRECNENCKNCNEKCMKRNEILHLHKTKKRLKTSLNAERSKNQS
jgi:hypothetical protein